MYPAKIEEELRDDIASFSHDPLGFVLYAFPWGEGQLSKHPGPRKWQRKYLKRVGERLQSGAATAGEVIQEARASGHGIGKSALVSWLVLWAMSTHEDTRGIVTANTDTQLRTKTWPEVSKWYHLAINKHWFVLSATALYSADPNHARTWRIDILPWSEHNTEAFAGLHNEGKRIVLIFDEASAIPEKIWEVAEGALTDEGTEIIWACFGNPTRNTGRFRECFGRLSHRWGHENIDSRTVEGTNKTQFDKWVEDYGEDSDFVRVRVRGLFPRASDMQFIANDTVAAAMQREPFYALYDPVIIGVDIARGGDDNVVIQYRRGFDAKTLPRYVIPGSECRDSMKLISKLVDLINNPVTDDLRPDAVFVDETGVGGPLVDRLRQLNVRNVHGVSFAESASLSLGDASSIQDGTGKSKMANKRAEIWWRMREWLREGGAIPDDAELERDLTGPEYGHNQRDQLLLEKKDDMKKRGLASPDSGDALALTFALPVGPRTEPKYRGMPNEGSYETDYDPYG